VNGLRQFLAALIEKFTSHFRVSRGRQQYFDEDIDPELWDLLEASALLQVTEFKVFELAYKDWFGTMPRPYIIEPHFNNYMFNRIIPVWVKHFCRRVVEMGREGTLDPRAFGVYPRQPSRRMMRIGQVYTALLLMAFLVLVLMAYGDRLFPDPESVMFGGPEGESTGYQSPGQNAMP